MKYIKLILIIAVVAGLIYGAFSIIGPHHDRTKIDPESLTLLNNLKKKVDKDWENASAWNQDVYDKNISDINAYRKDLDKSAAGNYTTLIDYTNEKVCNKLVEFLNNEFALSNCSQSNISVMKSNMDYFVKKNGTITASDSRISSAYGKITLYNNILSFGKKSFGLSPEFNINSGNWNNFSAYRESLLKTRDNFKKDRNFSALSHITEVNNSLNSTEKKLGYARNRFEQNLSNEIIAAYSSVPRTTANQKQLQYVYNKYYESYTDGNKLSNFRKQFNKEVEEENKKQ